MRRLVGFLAGLLFLVSLCLLLGSNGDGTGCGGDDTNSSSSGTCPSGDTDCGDPVGGPACCPAGDSCCFGYNLCCDENKPHLGVDSNGTKACYSSLLGEGETWTLLTVCGVPVN